MEPRPESKQGEVTESAPGPSKRPKMMELTPGPSRLECPSAEVLDSNELRETSDNKIMEPAPGTSRQKIIVKDNIIHGDFHLSISHSTTNITENARQVAGSDDLSSDPLIYGFPTRLEDEDCVGREKDIAELFKLVEKNKYVLVRGCGGIGKTTLAMKCAEMWTEAGRFKKAALLLMENEEAAKTSFIGLAEECTLKLDNDFSSKLRSFYDKLNKNKVLIIFDNIGDKMAIKRYLPHKTNHFNIFLLGTSQHDIPLLFHGYKLSELPQRAAVKLVFNILSSPTGIPEKLLNNLVQSLDCLALAVRQAACVIYQDVEETGKDIVKAIETYIEKRTARLNDEIPQEFLNYYGKTVYASLRYNISKCVKDDDLAKNLLHVISYLHPMGIEKDMISCVPGVAEEVVKRFIYRFVKYSIAGEYKNIDRKFLTMHRTTQAVVRHAYADSKGDVLVCLFHMVLTYSYRDAYSHLPYVLPEMSENLLTEGYRKLFTSDTYKIQKEELEKHEEGLVLEWKAPQYAAYLGHGEVLERLRQLNSPDTWITESGWTWIHAAALDDQGYVLNGPMPDSSIKDKQIARTGSTALHLAARAGSGWCITRLIGWGINLNIRDVRGDSALNVALSQGHLDISRALLEAGSEINRSENAATYSVIREFKFSSLITGRKDLLKVDIQYLYITVDDKVEGTKPKKLSKLSKFVNSPRNTQMLKEIQHESGEFGDLLKKVDGIWEAAVVASRYMQQRQLTARQLVEEISGEEPIHDFRVLYPPQADLCARALAFTKLLLNNIKNTSSDAFSILAILAALSKHLTVGELSRYLDTSTDEARAAAEVLEGYGIRIIIDNGNSCDILLFMPENNVHEDDLNAVCVTDEIRSLTLVYMTREKLPSDTCVSLCTTALCESASFDESIVCLVLNQITLQELTGAYKRASFVNPEGWWEAMLDKLQEAGCSTESPPDVTWSALHYAVVLDNILEYVIEKLLEWGVGVDVRGPGDVTPLHMAALCDISEALRILVKKGAKVNAVTHEGLTPVHMAASSDSWSSHEIVAALLGAGAQVNAVTHEGLTPLHMAVSSGSLSAHETVAILLEAGGQVNAATHEGLTPLHIIASSDSSCADYIVAALLKAGGQVNAVTPDGLTPLHMAASSDADDAHETVAAFLRAGGQVNALTHESFTPLHMAASSGSESAHKIVAALLGTGGQVNALTHEGLTPLHFAASDAVSDLTMRELVQGGAEPQIQDKKGRTPLDMAGLRSRGALMSLLKY